MKTLQLLLATSTILLLLAGHVQPQNNQPQRQPPAVGVELLTMAGGKPTTGPDGEGISSFRTSDLFKVGKTQVKPFDSSFKIELPVGYVLFKNLAYMIDTDAVFSGPNDFTFKIPSATTREVFDNLTILYAAPDEAQPDKPRWIDATVEAPFGEYWERYLSKPQFEQRLPDFNTRTIHAVTEDSPRVLVVAVMDPAKVRAHFVADVAVSATPSPASVMEGRPIDYTFKVTNNGPDTATSVSFRTYVTPNLISLEQSQGVCRWAAHNIYCNLGDIPKGHAATITFHGRCVWNFYYGDRPNQSGGMDAEPFVTAAEGDPNAENNMVLATAAVEKDPNKPPVVEIVSPTQNQYFVGPEPNVKIVVKAYDPDGKIGRIQLYNEKGLLGSPKLTGGNSYELDFVKAPYGQHFLQAIAEDDQGRPTETRPPLSFFVNGQAKIEILSPRENQIIIGPIKELPVTVRVTDSVRPIKKVTVHLGGLEFLAQSSERKDEYLAVLKETGPGSIPVYVDAIDDAGVQTLAKPIQFKVTEPPHVKVSYVDGGFAKDLTNEIVLTKAPITLITYVDHYYPLLDTAVATLEVFANQKSICRYVNTEQRKTDFFFTFNCRWSPTPGQYTITAVATDVDGATGNLTPITVKVQ